MAIIKPKRGYTNPTGLTQYELAVDLANKRIFIGNTGGTGDILSQYIQNYVVSFNGITGAVTGVTTGIGNTFGPLQTFTNGISALGGTFFNDILVNGVRVGEGGGSVATNVAVGQLSLAGNSTGSNNVAIGYETSRTGITASNTTAVGYRALYLNTVSDNTAVGSGALDANTSGVLNVAVGKDALGANTTGGSNVAVGHSALVSHTTGSNNNAFGEASLYSLTTGSGNVGVGRYALYNVIAGNSNVGVGLNAGFNFGVGGVTTSSSTVCVGANSGRWRGSGTDTATVAIQSIFLGDSTRPSGDSETNQIVIGYNALGDGSNTTVIGNSSTTSTRVFGTLSTNGGLSAAGLTLSGAFSGSTATFTGLITSTAGFSGTGITLSGNLSAATKSFVIPHPTKPGMQLQYGSLEGPENGVYVRGRLVGSNTIDLPDYWPALIHEDSITVQLTPYGSQKNYFVKSIENNQVIVGSKSKDIDCFYLVQAERKDVPKLVVEA